MWDYFYVCRFRSSSHVNHARLRTHTHSIIEIVEIICNASRGLHCYWLLTDESISFLYLFLFGFLADWSCGTGKWTTRRFMASNGSKSTYIITFGLDVIARTRLQHMDGKTSARRLQWNNESNDVPHQTGKNQWSTTTTEHKSPWKQLVEML